MKFLQHLGLNQPAGKTLRHFGDKGLTLAMKRFEKLGVAAIALIERQPGEPNPVALGPFDHLQGDLPLGPMGHLVGNARLLATTSIIGPGFRQEQAMIQRAAKSAASIRIAQSYGDDTVVDLPGGAAVLTLNPGCFVAPFGKAGLIDQADRLFAQVGLGNQLLQAIQRTLAIPCVRRQKILQRSRCHAQSVSHWLDTFAADVRQLATHVSPQMLAPFAARRAIVEQTQETIQITRQPTYSPNIHVPVLQPVVAGDDIEQTTSNS